MNSFQSISPIRAAEKLNEAIRGICITDEAAFFYEGINAVVYPQFSSDWVSSLYTRLKKLNAIGSEWHKIRAEITSNAFSPVKSYCNLLEAANKTMLENKSISQDEVLTIYKSLMDKASENTTSIRKISNIYDSWINSVKNITVLLEESMREGWASLDVEESDVIELSSKLAVLEKNISDVQDQAFPIGTSIGKDTTKSIVTFVYTCMIAGEEISLFSVLSMFLSVGLTFYDIISTYMDMEKYTEELVECKQKYTFKEQALAQTKSLIKLLQKIKESIISVRSHYEGIIDIWDSEYFYIESLINSYRAGKPYDPSELYLHAAMWKNFDTIADTILCSDFKTESVTIKI